MSEPTDHFASMQSAVALAYSAGAAAPTVVAKGRGLVAQAIIERARQHGIFVHQSSELVSLLMQVDLDKNIPPSLYRAVAELLAWLYHIEKLKNGAISGAASTIPDAQPDLSALLPEQPLSPSLTAYTMKPKIPSLGTENQSPFQVDSRKEIILLLRGLQESRQLINMIINEGTEVIVTAMIKVDDENDSIIFDCASTESANQRLIEAPRVYFEASLNRISIQFSTPRMVRTHYMGAPALSCEIPSSMIRLQRREYYRINTPITHPILCVMHVPEENGGGTANLPLVDISCGGIAVLDEKRVLNADFGALYEHSKIELPGIGLISVTLQVRNAQNLLLMNHKTTRRVGMQFIDMPNTIMAQVQKLITKIERERNSRQSGMM